MTKTRDSQWGKIRDAISELDVRPYPTTDELQDFADSVLRSRWYRNRYRLAHPGAVQRAENTGGLLLPPRFIVQSRSRSWQSCKSTYYAMDHRALWTPCSDIRSPSQPSELGCLHVLSHLLVVEEPEHSPTWAMTFLKVVERYGSEALGEAMRASFKQHRVKTFTWSDDAKAAAKVRAAEKQFRTAGDRARALVAALEAED